jgi:hypothetical protein
MHLWPDGASGKREQVTILYQSIAHFMYSNACRVHSGLRVALAMKNQRAKKLK